MFTLQTLKKSDGSEYLIICDEKGIFTEAIESMRSIAKQLLTTTDALSNHDLLHYEKEALLAQQPHMYPQCFSEHDPEWQTYLANATPQESITTKPKQGFVYIVASGLFHKIGATANLKKRLSSLSTMCCAPVELVAAFQSNDVYKSEKQFHEHFASKRQHGEWFLLSDDDIIMLRNHPNAIKGGK